MKKNLSYRASTITTKCRRNPSQIEALDSQIIEVLKADHPQSVRHVFYRMTDPRLPEPVEKSDRGYRHVQDRCVKLRRSGRIPYGWFADLSRRGYFVSTFADASDFVTRMAGLYRADLWQHADCRCEVWAERAVSGNLNKRLSGKPATFDAHIGRRNGAGDDEENEAQAWSSIQGQGGLGGAIRG